MTVDDVLKMVEVKLSDDLVIAQIRKNARPFALSADDLVRLKTKGVSEAVIRVMLDPKSAEPAAARTSADTEQPGKDRPTTDAARQALQRRLTGPLAGKLSVAKFSKTDGQSKVVNGVQVYVFEFEASVDFLDDMLYKMSDRDLETAPMASTLNDGRDFNWDAWFNTAVADRKPAFMGDKLNLIGIVTFERWESGWASASITFRGTVDASGRAPGHGPRTSPVASTTPPSVPVGPRPGTPEALIEESTRADQNTRDFPVLTRVIATPIGALWNKTNELLAKNKDKVAVASQDRGLIITELTKHGGFPFVRYDKYCIVLESVDEAATRIVLKALLYSPVVGKSGTLVARPRDRVSDQASKFLDQLGAASQVVPKETKVNSVALTKREEERVRFIAAKVRPKLPGGLDAQVEVAARSTWWSLKEGVLSLEKPFEFSNCSIPPKTAAEKARDVRLQPLEVCSGTIWQVGIGAVQVGNFSDADVSAAISTLLPTYSVTDVLSEAASFAGFDPNSEVGVAIASSKGPLQKSWLLRHPVLAMYFVEKNVASECVAGEKSWCFGSAWPQTRDYAPTKDAALKSIGDLRAIFQRLAVQPQ